MSASGPTDDTGELPVVSPMTQSVSPPSPVEKGSTAHGSRNVGSSDGIKWLDVPLFPFRVARRGWRKLPSVARSTIRVIVWLALLTGAVWVALSYGSTAFQSVVGWKSGAEWEAFLQRFITSPAAAGSAALLAAIIAARSFAKGLAHTKQEAQANRLKEAAEAWWEQFEWVTDRIVPKDPKQERLHKGLATSLLRALKATAEGKFQREAVDGIRLTYVRGTAVPLSEATLGELRAQLREVRTFAEASWISGDTALQNHVRAYVYLLEILVALRTTWEPADIIVEPAEKYRWKAQSKVHALVRVGRKWVVVNGTTRQATDLRMRAATSLDRVIEHMDELNADFLVVVALNPLQNETWQQTHHEDARIRLIHWDPEEDASELRKRIELHVGPDGPISALLRQDQLG